MNRHVKLSIVLVAVLLTIACMFTACGNDLEAKVDENAAKAETAVKDAADKAAADLATAKTALEKAIAAGDAAALAEAAADLEDAIEAAEKAAADADAALEAAIAEAKKVADDATVAITKVKNDLASNIKKVTVELEKAQADLVALLEAGDAANKADLATEKAALEAKILAAESLISDNKTLIGNLETALGNKETALNKAISDLADAIDGDLSALETKLSGAINAHKEAAMTLADWGEATDAVLAAWDELIALYDAVNPALYADAQLAELYTAYDVAYIKIMRAVNVAALDVAVKEFADFVDALPSITDVIEAKLDEAGETVDDITLDDADIVAAARKLIDDVMSSGNLDAIKDLDDRDLDRRCAEYEAELARLAAQANGAEIKAKMDAATDKLITADTDLTVIRNLYNAWIATDGNDLDDVPGFADSLAKFEAAEARVAELKTAKTEAEAINTEIEAIYTALVADGATISNQQKLSDITTLVNNWDATYFAVNGDYADDAVIGNVNYDMLDHELYNVAVAKYEELVKNFKEAADKFLAALNAIGEVDLLKGDEIEAAWDAYYAWVLEAKLSSFDYVLDVAGGHGPDYYYDELVTKANEFKNLAADALAAYEALTFDGTVTIYSEPEIDAVLGWYETYAVVVDGEYAFDYVLSEDVTVTAEDYADILAAEALCDELMAAKDAETQAVEDLITAIGNVTIADEEAIQAAVDAYDEWAAEIDPANDRYVVENLADLEAAIVAWDALRAEADAIHTAIEDLAEMNVADDRAAYEAAINAINTAIDTFKTNNGGDLEGEFTDAELAILTAAELALDKDVALEELANLYNAKKALTTDATKLEELELAYNKHVKAITEAVDSAAVADLMAIAEAQFDAILA